MTATRKTKPIRHHSRNGRSGSLIDSANRLGHDAKAVAMEHLVRPTLHAVHDMSEAIELRAHNTSTFLQDTLKRLEKKAVKNIRGALGCTLGVGVLLGMWLRRR
jgi:hypothetical protein